MTTTFLALFSCLFYIVLVNGQEDVFESFTQDVQNALPTGDFLKLFKLNHDSVEQVMRALYTAGSTFAATLETAVPEDIVTEFNNRAKKFDSFNSEQFFKVYAQALAGTLGDQGILYSGNEKELADSYVDALKNAAESVDGDSILNTVPEVAKAAAQILKDNGLSGFELIVRNFANNLLRAIDQQN